MATKGREFGQDTPWQRELEEAFAFVETPDQLSTIDDVKEDMEKPVPMDRLVCGDVGFGKTEIAVRAAFKAIQDGTQVALLCPTTLLVKQHVDTFAERFAPFPVKVAALSRFQSDKEAKAVVEGLADGSIDMVIGTHRLITGSVRFKQLGLVIIDEEQRFGVEHKETLKALRTDVDVLAMSATPIPRTLELAVTGIREMSTLATPPEERHPILTYVGPQETAQVAAAIRRELLRDGQVFYIHNSVKTITRAAVQLSELVPEARIAVAHGQMSEKQLEQVIVDYYDKQYDVLVCTTIVETGLDISNANTLIVERADTFGLSQLHQLRGRVGRGPRPRLRVLPVPAREDPHRDRARPSRDHRRQYRPGFRHGRRAQGPRDSRRRQPPGRRAVRATSRASASTSTSAWSGRPSRASAAKARKSARRSRSTCRSTLTFPPSTSSTSACAWRLTAPSPMPRTRPRCAAAADALDDRYGAVARAGVEPLCGRADASRTAPPRCDRRGGAGQVCALRADRTARLRRHAHHPPVPRHADQAGRPQHPCARAHHGAHRRLAR